MHRSPNKVSNRYGISEQDEREIRARDKRCVYCRTLLKQYPHAMSASGATIEHFNNNGPFTKKYNVAICCRRCNSSKGTMSLSAWFKTVYCRGEKINNKTVLRRVKEYMRLKKLSQLSAYCTGRFMSDLSGSRVTWEAFQLLSAGNNPGTH
jgi:hypothetical protein